MSNRNSNRELAHIKLDQLLDCVQEFESEGDLRKKEELVRKVNTLLSGVASIACKNVIDFELESAFSKALQKPKTSNFLTRFLRRVNYLPEREKRILIDYVSDLESSYRSLRKTKNEKLWEYRLEALLHVETLRIQGLSSNEAYKFVADCYGITVDALYKWASREPEKAQDGHVFHDLIIYMKSELKDVGYKSPAGMESAKTSAISMGNIYKKLQKDG